MSYYGGPEPSVGSGGILGVDPITFGVASRISEGCFARGSSNHWRPVDRKVSRSRTTFRIAKVRLVAVGQVGNLQRVVNPLGPVQRTSAQDAILPHTGLFRLPRNNQQNLNRRRFSIAARRAKCPTFERSQKEIFRLEVVGENHRELLEPAA